MKNFILWRVWRCDTCKCLLLEGQPIITEGKWCCDKCKSQVVGVYHELIEDHSEGQQGARCEENSHQPERSKREDAIDEKLAKYGQLVLLTEKNRDAVL